MLPGGGKGVTMLDSFLGAFGEMAERLLGTLHSMAVHERMEWATYADLVRQGRSALGPDQMPLFAPEQYAVPKFDYVPFRSDSLLGWVEGQDLVSGEPILVPAQLVLMYYKPLPDERPIGYATTAGCAFHTSRRQAILHGLYEVIERDCVNVHWYSKLPPPRVEVDLTEVLPSYFRAHRIRMSTPYVSEVQIFHAALDAPIPVLTAIAVDRSRSERAFLGGSGASTRREFALGQALFEVGQCQTGFRCDNPFGRNPIYEDSDSSEVIEFFDAPLYFGFPKNLARTSWYAKSGQTMAWEDVPTLHARDETEEYRLTLDWLHRSGLKAIVFDFSSACWPGVSITKVFVPGLSQACPPRNPMLGHPRFYKLPKTLGLRNRDLEFSDLSVDPVPFA
jgi:ribosomal protein S12 methylthiotransferase accessory factor